MRIIAKKTLRDYWEKYANYRKELEEWYGIAIIADWGYPHDIKQFIPKASIITGKQSCIQYRRWELSVDRKVCLQNRNWVRTIYRHAQRI